MSVSQMMVKVMNTQPHRRVGPYTIDRGVTHMPTNRNCKHIAQDRYAKQINAPIIEECQ